jgi:2-succinyl-5-enolpyruvyl-6-hydroxy-3-cyclohexene-1-carboxylate synthase
MAIRDLDLFGPASSKRLRVLANRGANGIEGIVSSGLGAASASDAPTLVVTGDLSFHHDLNGLSALRDGTCRATIVIVNNDGGGIFSFLPVAKHTEPFERYFGTPHGLDFRHAAELYGIPFTRPRTLEELREETARSLERRESLVIEVRTDRTENVADHRALWAEAVRAVEEVL